MREVESLWETAPSDVDVVEWEGPSEEDWQWFLSVSHVDPAERVM